MRNKLTDFAAFVLFFVILVAAAAVVFFATGCHSSSHGGGGGGSSNCDMVAIFQDGIDIQWQPCRVGLSRSFLLQRAHEMAEQKTVLTACLNQAYSLQRQESYISTIFVEPAPFGGRKIQYNVGPRTMRFYFDDTWRWQWASELHNAYRIDQYGYELGYLTDDYPTAEIADAGQACVDFWK